MPPERDLGSFRDPSGYVFIDRDCVWRSVNRDAAADLRSAISSGLVADLIERGLIIEATVDSRSRESLEQFRGPRGDLPELILKHPRLPFISYPYEWTFSQLQDAAVAHLELQIAALARNFALSDATPYNMQFFAGRVSHIDILSLRRYTDGEPWHGYNQFCRQFLLPLLLEAWCGVPFQPLLRGRIEGIEFADAVRIFPGRKLWFNINGLVHVSLHARAIARSAGRGGSPESPGTYLSKKRYQAILESIRDWIVGLTSNRPRGTVWGQYSIQNTYSATMSSAKEQFVRSFVAKTQAPVTWDIGGNSGQYSLAALAAGARCAVVLDSDLDALEQAYAQRRQSRLELIPIVADAADPSPGMGWNQAERQGLNERRGADIVLGLALLHHLVIGRNVPLGAAVDWLIDMAPKGIIEFVPRTDPMAREMLARRKETFPEYNEAEFRAHVERRARIVDEHRFEENGRVLLGYDRSGV